MVREWGMSDRVGPMAWGSQGQVFLGDDLMHSRDYSDDTARVIDEEVERVLREQDQRAEKLLMKHRKGLDLIARSLVEHETIDGAEVARLIELGDHNASASTEPGDGGNGGAPGSDEQAPQATVTSAWTAGDDPTA
jgi:ATP-dependent Zn protease